MTINRIAVDHIDEALGRGATVLVPNRLQREAVLAGLAAHRGGELMRTPRVLAVDIWVEKTWERLARQAVAPCCTRRVMSAAEEMYLWSEVIEASLERLPLLHPQPVAELASRTYRDMRQWIPPQRLAAELQANAAIPDVAAFSHWSDQFSKRCKETGLVSRTDAIHQLVPCLQEAGRMPSREFLLVNFLRAPPLYESLFEVLPGVRRLATGTTAKVPGATERRLEFENRDAEMLACAHWARQLMETDPDCHIGVVMNADRDERRRCEMIFQRVLEPGVRFGGSSSAFNTGTPTRGLLDTGMVHDAFLILNLVHQRQDSEDICRLLRSPFLVGAGPEREARLEMQRLMRRRFLKQCSLRDVARYLGQADRAWHCPQLAAGLEAFRKRLASHPTTMTALQWGGCCNGLLADLGWPGPLQDRRQQALLRQWQEVLAAFRGAAGVMGPMKVSRAISRLRLGCGLARLRRPYHPQAQLSLYSLDEAPGLDYDHLWLLGLDDQSWPGPARPSPFLPWSLQQEFRIPGSDSQVQAERVTAAFTTLRQSVSGSLTVSHHLRSEDRQLRPAALIQPLPLEPLAFPRGSVLPAGDPANPISMEEIPDETLPLKDGEEVRGGQGIISDQSACPFRAFARYRLGAQTPNPFASGLSALERGTAVHNALESMYKRGAPLHGSPEQISLACQQAAQEAIETLKKRYRELMSQKFTRIELERMTELLERFLALERSRHGFTPEEHEPKERWSCEGLNLELRIDRIDRLEDGSLAVIDYKTGKNPVRPSMLQEARPEDMQLPLYCTAIAEAQRKPVNAVVVAHVNAEKVAYSGLSADGSFHTSVKVPASKDDEPQWPRLVTRWRMQVQSLAREFSSGVGAVNPVKGVKSCRYCDLQALCRIQESGADPNSADDDGESS